MKEICGLKPHNNTCISATDSRHVNGKNGNFDEFMPFVAWQPKEQGLCAVAGKGANIYTDRYNMCFGDGGGKDINIFVFSEVHVEPMQFTFIVKNVLVGIGWSGCGRWLIAVGGYECSVWFWDCDTGIRDIIKLRSSYPCFVVTSRETAQGECFFAIALESGGFDIITLPSKKITNTNINSKNNTDNITPKCAAYTAKHLLCVGYSSGDIHIYSNNGKLLRHCTLNGCPFRIFANYKLEIFAILMGNENVYVLHEEFYSKDSILNLNISGVRDIAWASDNYLTLLTYQSTVHILHVDWVETTENLETQNSFKQAKMLLLQQHNKQKYGMRAKEHTFFEIKIAASGDDWKGIQINGNNGQWMLRNDTHIFLLKAPVDNASLLVKDKLEFSFYTKQALQHQVWRLHHLVEGTYMPNGLVLHYEHMGVIDGGLSHTGGHIFIKTKANSLKFYDLEPQMLYTTYDRYVLVVTFKLQVHLYRVSSKGNVEYIFPSFLIHEKPTSIALGNFKAVFAFEKTIKIFQIQNHILHCIYTADIYNTVQQIAINEHKLIGLCHGNIWSLCLLNILSSKPKKLDSNSILRKHAYKNINQGLQPSDDWNMAFSISTEKNILYMSVRENFVFIFVGGNEIYTFLLEEKAQCAVYVHTNDLLYPAVNCQGTRVVFTDKSNDIFVLNDSLGLCLRLEINNLFIISGFLWCMHDSWSLISLSNNYYAYEILISRLPYSTTDEFEEIYLLQNNYMKNGKIIFGKVACAPIPAEVKPVVHRKGSIYSLSLNNTWKRTICMQLNSGGDIIEANALYLINKKKFEDAWRFLVTEEKKKTSTADLLSALFDILGTEALRNLDVQVASRAFLSGKKKKKYLIARYLEGIFDKHILAAYVSEFLDDKKMALDIFLRNKNIDQALRICLKSDEMFTEIGPEIFLNVESPILELLAAIKFESKGDYTLATSLYETAKDKFERVIEKKFIHPRICCSDRYIDGCCCCGSKCTCCCSSCWRCLLCCKCPMGENLVSTVVHTGGDGKIRLVTYGMFSESGECYDKLKDEDAAYSQYDDTQNPKWYFNKNIEATGWPPDSKNVLEKVVDKINQFISVAKGGSCRCLMKLGKIADGLRGLYATNIVEIYRECCRILKEQGMDKHAAVTYLRIKDNFASATEFIDCGRVADCVACLKDIYKASPYFWHLIGEAYENNKDLKNAMHAYEISGCIYSQTKLLLVDDRLDEACALNKRNNDHRGAAVVAHAFYNKGDWVTCFHFLQMAYMWDMTLNIAIQNNIPDILCSTLVMHAPTYLVLALADMLEKMGKYLKAGGLHERAGAYEKAAKTYLRDNTYQGAQECLRVIEESKGSVNASILVEYIRNSKNLTEDQRLYFSQRLGARMVGVDYLIKCHIDIGAEQLTQGLFEQAKCSYLDASLLEIKTNKHIPAQLLRNLQNIQTLFIAQRMLEAKNEMMGATLLLRITEEGDIFGEQTNHILSSAAFAAARVGLRGQAFGICKKVLKQENKLPSELKRSIENLVRKTASTYIADEDKFQNEIFQFDLTPSAINSNDSDNAQICRKNGKAHASVGNSRFQGNCELHNTGEYNFAENIDTPNGENNLGKLLKMAQGNEDDGAMNAKQSPKFNDLDVSGEQEASEESGSGRSSGDECEKSDSDLSKISHVGFVDDFGVGPSWGEIRADEYSQCMRCKKNIPMHILSCKHCGTYHPMCMGTGLNLSGFQTVACTNCCFSVIKKHLNKVLQVFGACPLCGILFEFKQCNAMKTLGYKP